MPDVQTVEGLLSVLMVGSLLEFSKVFSHAAYIGQESPEAAEERNAACLRYRQFMAWFASNHTTHFNGSFVNPWYIAHRLLIEFGSSLCAYKEVASNEELDDSLTVAKLKRMVTHHIKSDWPMLLPRFSQLLDSPTRSFQWTGPDFVIYRRDKLLQEFVVPELNDLPVSPVFSELEDKGLAMDIDVAAEGDGGPSEAAMQVEAGDGGLGDDGQYSEMVLDSSSSNTPDSGGHVDAEEGALVAEMSATSLGPRLRAECEQFSSPAQNAPDPFEKHHRLAPGGEKKPGTN
jgi:hypothetical protein